jgi:hypothetical protein
MNPWATRLAAALLALSAAGARAADTRFTLTLTAIELADAGLKRLSSDQVAVIDALVRRDLAKNPDAAPPAPAAPRFSQRLTDDERRIAGCALLDATELARLDALVERFEPSRKSTARFRWAWAGAPAATARRRAR